MKKTIKHEQAIKNLKKVIERSDELFQFYSHEEAERRISLYKADLKRLELMMKKAGGK